LPKSVVPYFKITYLLCWRTQVVSLYH